MTTRAAILVTMLGASTAALAAPQAFRAGTDVVRVPVIVTRHGGEPVHGLSAGDFNLREDGQIQDVQFFAEGATGAALPLHLGLLLDTSGSMQDDLSDAMRAAIQFVNAIEESVDVTLVQFDSTIASARFAPPNYPRLFERIRAQKAAGMTALYDAVAVYLQDAMDRDGQHVLVMYTDGGDSSSTIGIGRLIELLHRAGNVIVYAIGYLQNQQSAGLEQRMRLGQIVDATGGAAYFPGSVRETTAIYARIVEELAARYTLGYVSSNRTGDGRFRKLQIKVTRPGLNGVTVRARPGYYAAVNR